jgi:hypothetical protein
MVVAAMTLSLLLLLLALVPEERALLLTQTSQWTLRGAPQTRLHAGHFVPKIRYMRRTATEPGAEAVLFRTWTPQGVQPLQVSSGPFKPTRYMSVAITGTNRTEAGSVKAYLKCEVNGRRLDIFNGNVNANLTEALIVAPDDWCRSQATLEFSSAETQGMVGVGSVYALSKLSYWKSSFLGHLPYFLCSAGVFALVMLAGAALAARHGLNRSLFPAALCAFGVVCLLAFYFSSAVMAAFSWAPAWITTLAAGLVVVLALMHSGRRHTASAASTLLPYGRVWLTAALAYFALGELATNGLAHWNPNYRFWPAAWSSDNELPWMFAEAIRNRWDLKDLFGGWLPTDRPPLMAGAHLLVGDLFAWMQLGNDGAYLTGQAYNASAVALNTLWVPTAWWLLGILRPGMDSKARGAILALTGLLPFAVFNSIYGWPKFFGAAFALAAFGLAMQAREPAQDEGTWRKQVFLFPSLCALSVLSHASAAIFLAPVTLLFLRPAMRRNVRLVVVAAGLGLVILGSWSAYKSLVLPSTDPVTKFALTGGFGFDRPGSSLWQLLASRYGEMGFGQWLQVKWTMLLQSFVPIDHAATMRVGLNEDFGQTALDRLRAWDFLLISKGNAAVPVLVLGAGWIYWSGRKDAARGDPAGMLICVSLAAWMLMVVFFLAPVVLHHWPQAALLALPLAAGTLVRERYPAFFNLTLCAVLAYTGVVWIWAPLPNALTVDKAAAFTLLLVLAWIAFPRRGHRACEPLS